MTFTEAAIEVLRREGKPLHFKKIAEIAVRDSLLDHVGKIPDEVMGGQLATHCRLPHADRKVVVVQSGTFALAEWGLDEDPAGLEGMIEQPPADEIPYRGRERHPTPSREIARSTARGEGRARRREEGEERRGRRFPPPAEVAYEILAGSDRALPLAEVAAQGAERLLMPDAFVRDPSSLGAALSEDNRRRESAGRKPLFAIDGELVSLAAQPEPGERAATPLAVARPVTTAADLRRSALIALRRRLRECDAPTVEHVLGKLLESMGLHDLKVAKRGRDHVVYTGRRRMGLADVRHCVRILRGGSEPGRRDVAEVRRDVTNYGAQIGVIVSAGEVGRDARGEATSAGHVPVLLVCGEALAEALAEHGVGCRQVIVPEVDEAFFKGATDAAQAEEAARRARREERERRDGREGRDREGADRRGGREGVAVREAGQVPAAAPGEAPTTSSPAAEEGAPAAVPSTDVVNESAVAQLAPGALAASTPSEGAVLDDQDEGDDGDEDEGDETEAPTGAAATPTSEGERAGEGRRRRRRRRRRGGRGRNREAGAGSSGGGGPAASGSGGGAMSTAGEGGAPAQGGPAPQETAPATIEPRRDIPAAPSGPPISSGETN